MSGEGGDEAHGDVSGLTVRHDAPTLTLVTFATPISPGPGPGRECVDGRGDCVPERMMSGVGGAGDCVDCASNRSAMLSAPLFCCEGLVATGGSVAATGGVGGVGWVCGADCSVGGTLLFDRLLLPSLGGVEDAKGAEGHLAFLALRCCLASARVTACQVYRRQWRVQALLCGICRAEAS